MAGVSRTPSASAPEAENARMRGRRYLNDILYPGTLTSRLKRYAAEPAPDAPNLTSISERTANDGETIAVPQAPFAGTDTPAGRLSRMGRPGRRRHSLRAARSPASGRSRT